MPIEIRELVIKATVGSDKESTSGNASSDQTETRPTGNLKREIADCINEINKRKKER